MFRDYMLLEIQRQYQAAAQAGLQAGNADLVGWRPAAADVDFVIEAVRRIVEQLV